MTDHEAAGILVEQDDAVLTITLNRPEARNAQTPAMWRALAAVGAGIDPAIRVVVLKGAGESFSAGLDRRMLSPEGIEGEPTFLTTAQLDDAGFDAQIAEYQEGFTWWRNPQFVSIAAVQGHAIGAGFQLALACDIRIVADDVRLNMKETALGLVPDLGGTKPLVEAVGYQRALELCATSRIVGGPEAQAIGIALASVPREELDATVADLTAALIVPQHGAVTALKELFTGASDRSYDEQRGRERSYQRGRFSAMLNQLGGNS
ncbi:MAG: enoyl-CoA hydratase/isomerase family protein [Aeromicrobium sp.]